MKDWLSKKIWLQELEQRLLRSFVPGKKAQAQMSALNRRVAKIEAHAREAAVLIALFEIKGDWKTVFIQRPSVNPNDPHAGQISLPGGKRESMDKSIVDTALREAEEEVGIQQNEVHWMGALSPLYIPVSNFIVHPQVGYLSEVPQLVPQVTEVDQILTKSLIGILDEANINYKPQVERKGMVFKNVPYFDLEGDEVWGATAMILSEFRALLKELYQGR